MITISYVTRDFKDSLSVESKRYVVKSVTGDYRFCVISNDRFDSIQGFCTADELSEEILSKCEEHGFNAFYACEWPIQESELDELTSLCDDVINEWLSNL